MAALGAQPVAISPRADALNHGSLSLAQFSVSIQEKNAAQVLAFLIPRLTLAGLEVRGFWGQPRAGHRNAYLEIRAPEARLLAEAIRLKWPLLLDAGALRAADIAENARLQEQGVQFSVDGSRVQHDELAIPVARLPCSLRAPRDPYSFVFAPYSAGSHGLYKVHAATASVLTQADALQLLSSCIESPHDTCGGAGLDLDSMVAAGKLAKFWAAHDPIQQALLEREWGSSPARAALQSVGLVPASYLNDVAEYYGTSVAFYFSFLSFYTRALVLPAIVGAVVFGILFPSGASQWLILYGIFVSLWATVFFEGWKRTQSDLALKWGTDTFSRNEPLRAEFTTSSSASRTRSMVDGKSMVSYSPVAYRSKLLGSGLLLSLFIGGVIIVVVSIFWLRTLLILRLNEWGIVWTSVINALQIQVMTLVYGWLAVVLTRWENASTDSEYTNSLTIKHAVFQTTNYFFSVRRGDVCVRGTFCSLAPPSPAAVVDRWAQERCYLCWGLAGLCQGVGR